jgi:hypothetical protein
VHQHPHGAQHDLDIAAQRGCAIGVVLVRDGEEQRQHRLRGQHGARFGPEPFPDQRIGVQAPLLERRREPRFGLVVMGRIKTLRRDAVDPKGPLHPSLL